MRFAGGPSPAREPDEMNNPTQQETKRQDAKGQRRSLYRNILDITRREAEAIKAGRIGELAELQDKKQAVMEKVDSIPSAPADADGGKSLSETRDIIKSIIELTEANQKELSRRIAGVKKSLDEIAETRRSLRAVRSGYGAGTAPQPICLDRKA